MTEKIMDVIAENNLKEKQASGLVDVVRRRIEGGSGVEIGMLRAAEQIWPGAADPRWF